MRSVLAQNDLGCSLGEESKSGSVLCVERNDGAHGLARRVERVDFTEPILGHSASNSVVVLTESQHEPEQSTLGLVADLFRQVALPFTRLTVTRCR